MVKPTAIERFRRKYILGPELAVFLGMSPKHTTHHLWMNVPPCCRAIDREVSMSAIRLAPKQKTGGLPDLEGCTLLTAHPWTSIVNHFFTALTTLVNTVKIWVTGSAFLRLPQM